jgi:hypothetical protein
MIFNYVQIHIFFDKTSENGIYACLKEKPILSFLEFKITGLFWI